MSRPSEHGGGEAAPPIAGDPSSFPSDAELSRTLVATTTRAALSTLTVEGYPYGSAVSYAVDGNGCPILLVSDMAEHTVNARHDPKASMLLVAETPDGADPLSTARLTLVGVLELLQDPGTSRETYLAAHPYASYYADFTDFGFWRLNVERCRFVGGFGHMSWVGPEKYSAADPDPLAESLKRLASYAAAGADCLYAPGIKTEAEIRAVLQVAGSIPVNVLAADPTTMTVESLRALGVSRISVGSALARVAWGAFIKASQAIASTGAMAPLAGAEPFASFAGFFEPDVER